MLLNNELDDFTAAPGASNAYGLVGFEANLPGPGKRPLSSMSPTIVLKGGKAVLVTGSPGGSRIISTVLQVIVNVLDYDMDVASAVAAPRLHHQWLPDEVRIERGFPDDVIAALKAKGHTIVEPLGQTSANSIAVTDHGLLGRPIRARGVRSRRRVDRFERRIAVLPDDSIGDQRRICRPRASCGGVRQGPSKCSGETFIMSKVGPSEAWKSHPSRIPAFWLSIAT